MKSIAAALALLVLAPLASAATSPEAAHDATANRAILVAQNDFNDSRIEKLLVGNSIINPSFGCAFYRPDGTMVQYGQGGQSQEGKWRVLGDIYYSTGQCGRSGCSLEGEFPNLIFRRLDGGYEQPVTVIRGNYCEKNGIFS